MTTKLELIQAAQAAAAKSLDITEAKALEENRKGAFDALSIPETNWQFFHDHFNGARSQYLINAEAPILPAAPAKK